MLPAAPPASSPPNPPLSMSLMPAPRCAAGQAGITLPGVGAGAGAGAEPVWLPLKCLMPFQASSARIAIVIGDIPPPLSDCALGVLGPRGPFCMPLSTSSKPMVVSSA